MKIDKLTLDPMQWQTVEVPQGAVFVSAHWYSGENIEVFYIADPSAPMVKTIICVVQDGGHIQPDAKYIGTIPFRGRSMHVIEVKP